MVYTERIVGEDIAEMLQRAAEETGLDLKATGAEIAAYAAQQAHLLSQALNEPGYEEAVLTARQNVALHAFNLSIEAADNLDRRVLGLIEGSLLLGARLILVA